MRSLPALPPPKLLGKYEVGAKIGGGGMATVYSGRATLEDGTEERVALKVIRDELECIANDIVLQPPKWLEKSSSGKISRGANRDKYLRDLSAKLPETA